MIDEFTIGAIWAATRVSAIVLAVSTIVALLVLFLAFLFRFGEFLRWELLASATAVAIFGGFVGQIGASSRTSAVGDLIPAVLTLLGGYSALVFGEKKPTSPTVLVNVLCFAFSFFLTFNVTAALRQDNESFEFCKSVYSNSELATGAAKTERDLIWSNYCMSVFDRWTNKLDR